MENDGLIGVGLYTPAEASWLSGISAPKLIRWLSGYMRGGREYAPLWRSQVDLGDGHVYLGFRDLMEARIANKFIAMGVPALHIRKMIVLARDVLGAERPLSTNRFRTDGRTIFLKTVETDTAGREREYLLNLFKGQYEFAAIIEPLLKDVEFDPRGIPSAWWPAGHSKKILIDPKRAFGQAIDAESSVPIAILANAGRRQGIDAAAKSYDVKKKSVRRAIEYVTMTELRRAA
jgi:uncharacterized protein (DUF433 family)